MNVWNCLIVDLLFWGNLFNPLNPWQKNLPPARLCEARGNPKEREL